MYIICTVFTFLYPCTYVITFLCQLFTESEDEPLGEESKVGFQVIQEGTPSDKGSSNVSSVDPWSRLCELPTPCREKLQAMNEERLIINSLAAKPVFIILRKIHYRISINFFNIYIRKKFGLQMKYQLILHQNA